MIKFLFKGLIRERARSLFPFLTVLVGVMLTVVLYNWLGGYQENLIRSSARFQTGHVKIMTRAYAEEADQIPNDLALLGVGSLLQSLKNDHPGLYWTPRVRFGGLLDVPDEAGETKAQGPVAGLAVDLFSPGTKEWGILELGKAVVKGRLPHQPGEMLLSDEFAGKLGLKPGDTATLISATMYGSLSLKNLTLSGTVLFGVAAMDRGMMIADLADVREALDMPDAAGEIIGISPDFLYRMKMTEELSASFNSRYRETSDEYAPVMVTLRDQQGLGQIIDMVSGKLWIIFAIFISIMSIVLWNAGLLASLRRYGEMGMRLAVGETHGHIYRTLILESLIVGFFGTVAGTLVGLAISYYLQIKGLNVSSLMENASLMFTGVMRARVMPESFFIGFIPGWLATVLGTCISGIGIYKRQTSQLFKELEV